MGAQDHYLMQLRRHDFPPQILEIAHSNPVVAEIVDAYCVGKILVKEEALAQMVVWLARNWDTMRDNYLKAFTLLGTPFRDSNIGEPHG